VLLPFLSNLQPDGTDFSSSKSINLCVVPPACCFSGSERRRTITLSPQLAGSRDSSSEWPYRLTTTPTQSALEQTASKSNTDVGALELPELLTLNRVECNCDLGSKKRILEKVAELMMDAFDDEELSDMHVLDALINRERLGSTGVGDGVALPHARMPSLSEPAAVLISLNEGVDFDALDEQKVDLIVGLLVPENCNDTHLQILRGLAKRFSNPNFRNSLRKATTQKELFNEAIRPANTA